MNEIINNKVKKILVTTIWMACFVVAGLIYYVSHYLPQGPMYGTGDVSCTFDGRGPCTETIREDLSNLDIPDWAKFFKGSEGLVLLFGLFLMGAIISNRDKNNSE